MGLRLGIQFSSEFFPFGTNSAHLVVCVMLWTKSASCDIMAQDVQDQFRKKEVCGFGNRKLDACIKLKKRYCAMHRGWNSGNVFLEKYAKGVLRLGF